MQFLRVLSISKKDKDHRLGADNYYSFISAQSNKTTVEAVSKPENASVLSGRKLNDRSLT